jgi:uncharacterized protein YutE (UPF0331/DUF86 family)
MREVEIRTKVLEITESIELISENIPDDIDEFVSLGLIKDGIYKRMEFCIENVFDICAMINSDLRLGIPEADENIVDNIVRAGILSSDWKDRLRGMKAFRNIMVHRYGRIDDRIAFSLIEDRINDFVLFVEAIGSFMKDHDKH